MDQSRTSALPHYPIEVDFPDLARWREGNCGVDYAHSFDSGKPGPHVMIMALTHGNEVSGAIALDTLLDAGLAPAAGRVTLVFGNVAAYQAFDPARPDATRYIDEDMNRVWSPGYLDGDGDSVELRRARALRPLVDSVDFLLDIHSMHEESAPLMMSGALVKGLRFAADLGVPADVVADAGHANGRRLRDYAGFGDPASPRNALLIETGQHFSARSRAVALDTARRFLAATGVMPAPPPPPPGPQRFLLVTHAVVAHGSDFAFAGAYRGLEVIADAGTVIGRDGDHSIVTPYPNCVIVQPSLRHASAGVTVMRLAQVLFDPCRQA